MIPTAFDYHRATSVEDAIRKLRDTGGKLLAGGHSLVPLMKLRLSEPTALIEEVVYNSDGQLVTGSFMDYALPRSTDFPRAVQWNTLSAPGSPSIMRS